MSSHAGLSGVHDLAVNMLERGRSHEAIHAFRSLLTIAPLSAEIYYNLGIALKDLHRRDMNRELSTATPPCLACYAFFVD